VLLLDASIWIAAAAPAGSWYAAAGALVRNPAGPLAALDLTMYEIANVVGVREGESESAQTLIKVLRRRCEQRIVGVDLDLLELALEIASEHRLSAYDAAYVAAARRTGSQLVSLDVRDLVSKGLAITPDAAV
jgi:predicted nucleic acid-binding protein